MSGRPRRSPLRRRAERRVFDGGVAFFGWLSRSSLSALTEPLMGALADVMRAALGAPSGDLSDPVALGAEWQRLMPNKRLVPITSVDADTAYGEIRIDCPLRGSGDLAACHRMMAFDRRWMDTAGARFVVLESQAEPGVTRCRIALRARDRPADDLVPAHERRIFRSE